MTKYIAQLRQRIDAFTLRQRVLLFFSLVVILYLLAEVALFGPLGVQQQQLRHRITDLKLEVASCEEQTRDVLHRQQIDPDAETRQQHTRLTAQIGALEQQISDTVKGLIAPQQMAQVLEEVIQRQSDLKLLRIESLETRPLIETGENEPEINAGIWRHRVRLEFQGDYLATLAYLHELQAMPWQLYWDELDITMSKYPQARVTIVVHTLSLQEGWIGV